LGVSSVEEGVALRNLQIQTPILILGSLYPFESFPLLFEHDLTPTIASLDAAQALGKIASERQKKFPIHLKIDSGFGRIGVSASSGATFVARIAYDPWLEIEGLYTHFASSDVDEAWTRAQTKAFLSVVEAARAQGIRPKWIHMANSAAMVRYPESHGTMVRPGIAYYGVPPFDGAERAVELKPALAWKSRVIFIKTVPEGSTISYARTWKAKRQTRVATLAAGYADGYPRLLSNKGQVLILGKRAPVVGRVTMDMTMVDVTDIPDCRIGDEAVLIGPQRSDEITALEVAGWAQTNAYEILSRIGSRVTRVNVHE